MFASIGREVVSSATGMGGRGFSILLEPLPGARGTTVDMIPAQNRNSREKARSKLRQIQILP